MKLGLRITFNSAVRGRRLTISGPFDLRFDVAVEPRTAVTRGRAFFVDRSHIVTAIAGIERSILNFNWNSRFLYSASPVFVLIQIQRTGAVSDCWVPRADWGRFFRSSPNPIFESINAYFWQKFLLVTKVGQSVNPAWLGLPRIDALLKSKIFKSALAIVT